MSNRLLLAVIAAAFIAGAVCGAAIKSLFPAKPHLTAADTKTEIVIRKIPVTIKETRYLPLYYPYPEPAQENVNFKIADSIKGIRENVEFSINHKMEKVKDSIESVWDISLFPLVQEFTREKIVTQLKEIKTPLPFYRDGWFWATFIAVPLLVLAIIF